MNPVAELMVSLLFPKVRVPEVKFNESVIVAGLDKVTPAELLTVRSSAVEGKPSPVNWAAVPLYI